MGLLFDVNAYVENLCKNYDYENEEMKSKIKEEISTIMAEYSASNNNKTEDKQ